MSVGIDTMVSRIALLIVAASLMGLGAARADPADVCAKIGNDDRVRPYDPRLRQGFVRAFHKLFPNARGGQSEQMLRSQGSYRCMDGRLFACFTGANLPCAKIDPARTNRGAAAFCRDTPNADVVPLVAAGHDALYQYRCRKGRAEVSGTNWTLDSRGFAKEVWTPID